MQVVIRTELKSVVTVSCNNSSKITFDGKGGLVLVRFDVFVMTLVCGFIAERIVVVFIRDLVRRVV